MILAIIAVILKAWRRGKEPGRGRKESVLDTYEEGFYPDIKLSKPELEAATGSRDSGVYTWRSLLEVSLTNRMLAKIVKFSSRRDTRPFLLIDHKLETILMSVIENNIEFLYLTFWILQNLSSCFIASSNYFTAALGLGPLVL